MKDVVARERITEQIAHLRRRLEDLSARRDAARAASAPRVDAEAWLAFLLLVVIVAGAGVWAGVAVRAVHPPAPVSCWDL